MCYIPNPMEKARAIAFPGFLSRWELAVIAAAIALLLVLALAGKGRRQREAYENFLRRAPKIEAALLAFAKDHDGRFPPDAMFTGMPQGLGPYIAWGPTLENRLRGPPERQGRALRMHGVLRALQGTPLLRPVQQA